MAECGVASRRKCEEFIRMGRVRVNGQTVTRLGTKVDEEKDEVVFNGEKLNAPSRKYYIVNKPSGYITSNSDPGGRKVIFDLVPDNNRLFAVGRLDRDTEGLIVLTNDGEFANNVAHPRNSITKTYEVTTLEFPDERQISLLKKGMLIDGYRTSPAKVKILREVRGKTVTMITICEGRNRQIRKMFDAAGLSVVNLRRTAIGGFRDTKLKPGRSRELSGTELDLILGRKGKR